MRSFADRLTEALLMSFTMTEILELNDLTEEDVLTILIEGGHIGEPERIVAAFEGVAERSEEFD